MSTETTDQATAVGLAPGMRYRCEGCGNLTRFDVVTSQRASRYWHADVAGSGRVEAEDIIEFQVESVTCRWCGSASSVLTERAPGPG